MQIKLFTIPALNSETMVEEMNAFLRGHKVLELRQELHPNSQGAIWCFCVRYIDGNISSTRFNNRTSAKVDYREILDERSFDIFSRLRECRKQIAKEEALPAYAVFIDEELAALSRLEALTEISLVSVEGIGEKKRDRFGGRLLELYNNIVLQSSENIGISV